MDYLGMAALIGAFGVFVTALAGAYVAVKSVVKVQEIHRMATAIDMAVNGRPAGSDTIGEDVMALKADLDDPNTPRQRT